MIFYKIFINQVHFMFQERSFLENHGKEKKLIQE